MKENKVVSIQKMIYEVRGYKVMLDSDLAKLYGVEVKALNRAVKRNNMRFPDDFMFQLSIAEWEILKYQIGTSRWGGKRKIPYVFTEHGIAMLSGLLNSEIAINVNIQIMRTFSKLRHYVVTQSDTNKQILELRKLLMLHVENTESKFLKHDKTIKQILYVLNGLIDQPPKTKKIGFCANDE